MEIHHLLGKVEPSLSITPVNPNLHKLTEQEVVNKVRYILCIYFSKQCIEGQEVVQLAEPSLVEEMALTHTLQFASGNT